MPVLRTQQQQSYTALLAGIAAGHVRQILYMPTGAGKTEVAIKLLQSALELGLRAAFVVDRRVLCDQTSGRLEKYKVPHGVLMSGSWRYAPELPIQICTAQTLEARGGFPNLDLLIIDEAHMSRESINNFMFNHPKVKVIGLTATPFTPGLGKIYSNVVSTTSTNDLIRDSWLVPLRVFVATPIDMSGAARRFGEWSDTDAITAGIKITGDIVAEWIKVTHAVFGGPKKTVVFSAGTAHAGSLARGFNDAGYNFVAISHEDSDEYRAEVTAEFKSENSSIMGLIATDLVTKGYDQPDIFIGVSARPFSKSISSHIQQQGRVMRPAPGKSFAVWIDHSGNYNRFAKRCEEIAENGVSELDDGFEKQMPEPTEHEIKESKCPACDAAWSPASSVCLSCGHVRVRRNDVVVLPGVVSEVTTAFKPAAIGLSKDDWYKQLLGYGIEHNYKSTWAYVQYKQKFKGESPPWSKESAPPSPEVCNWAKSRQIAFIQSLKRGGASR